MHPRDRALIGANMRKAAALLREIGDERAPKVAALALEVSDVTGEDGDAANADAAFEQYAELCAKDWIVTRCALSQDAQKGFTFYPFHVSGVNLSSGDTFRWNVRDVNDPRYDLARVSVPSIPWKR